ncbi:hypothetical protein KSP39_PZI013811 [Platanthera zijinensis]|uniref:HEAT repeat-containing protein 1 n=1 Tax=Platanthera zijinensis TaxID=2320716 RepID=A0AAP0BCX3_9ASPA
MSITSQLQVIKSLSKGKEDQIHRPLTRPSVLFGPKEAADIDLRLIFPLAQSGLDALIEADDRFSTYKTTIFSHATLDINREKMPPKEEEKLNKSICSYLQLLAGHLHLPASLRTLEYLIRRYQIHIFNVEELVLCALPYHDTQAFVRIVQLLDFGNKKWAFLEGVKTSGAPPPRKVIVNQCVRDKGVLEALCNYASPMKGFQHSRPVICFCTAVTVDVLGSIPKLDTDILQRILTFVFNGLNPTISGIPDHGAGALMIVGLVATRTTLAYKLVQNMILFIAQFARHEASKSSDLQRLRLAVVALVTLVQVLLKPIISQLIVEPPVTSNDFLDSPTVEEVDHYLVLCLGQMAVTVKSDVLWKPLNHEVLMQTRSELVRPKIVGLKVIKYLVEHLREEYLAFLPETIPFLGELLEDVELPVKTLAQEILRSMEALSGESLKEYL